MGYYTGRTGRGRPGAQQRHLLGAHPTKELLRSCVF
jgi:hypothetical protein